MSKFNPFLALEASAGSGKTYALSVRYISLLYLGANPSKILTLTFTNKAAHEMKSRIYETLVDLEERDELVSISEQVGLTCKEIIERKDEVLERFLKDDLLISTIDSFFAGILRKFALNAGFMPDFKIDTDLLHVELLEKFLRLCIQEKKYNSLIKFAINEDKKLSDVFDILDGFYDKEGEFDANIFPKSLHVKAQSVLDIQARLKECFELEGATGSLLKTFDDEEISGLIKRGYLKKDSLEYWQYKKHVTPLINELFDELKSTLAFYLNAREAYLLGELADLYSLYKRAIRSLNKEINTLSFSDVTNAIFSLLRDEISKEFLYFRLDGKIDHILIDEFQDTNVMQYKILEPLMREVSSGVGVQEFKSLFFVGDTKQSIYRFRGGAKELFAHAIKEFNVTKEVLDTNYRSSKNVVEYVNSIFKDKIKGYEKQKVKKDGSGYVEVCFGDEIPKLVLEKLEYFLKCGVTQKDIAILVHQNKDAQTLKELLIENIDGIKVQTEASIKLISVPIVGAILDLLKHAYFKDELYKHNFLVAIGEDWRGELDISWLNINLAPSLMISHVVKRFEIFDDDMDIIKLIEISSRYDDIESFLFECEDFNEDAKSQDNDGVKILTIHKSKGLEFLHVIVADRFGSKRSGGGTLLYEYNDINLVGIYQRVAAREFLDKKYKIARDKEEILELEDVVNMHYVAFTRAKSSLVVCAKEQKSAFSFLDLSECVMSSVEVTKEEQQKEIELAKMNQTLQRYGSQVTEKKEEEVSKESDFFAIEYGLAMHYMIELMSSFDESSLRRAYISIFNKYSTTLSKDSLQSIYKRVENLVKNKQFLDLIADGKIYKEQPISYNGERKQLDLLIEKDDDYM